MSVPLSGPMLAPRSGKPPRQLIVLLHGYGSNGADLISLGTYWRDMLPEALFVAPNAPEPVPGTAEGYQWMAMVPGDALPLSPGGFIGGSVRAAAARSAIVALLEARWAQTGLGPTQTMLVGFSQGAMMALHVGLSLDTRLCGIVAFSGLLIPPRDFWASAGAKPPVCLVHGELDDVVEPAGSAEAARILDEKGFEVTYHVSGGARHTIAPDGLEVAGRFIAREIARLANVPDGLD